MEGRACQHDGWGIKNLALIWNNTQATGQILLLLCRSPFSSGGGGQGCFPVILW